MEKPSPVKTTREKLPYEKPQLISYGDLHVITRGPGGGGADGGGGPGHTHTPCWVAAVLYGEADPRTAMLRCWLVNEYGQTTAGRCVVGLYRNCGQLVARWLRRAPVLQPIARPLFNTGVERAQRYYMGRGAA
jgi:hypothetical protein